MAENKYLAWIKKYKDILSISNLEAFIGLPISTLKFYISGDRAFPSKHIKKLEKRMAIVVKMDNPFILIYISELISEYYARQKQIVTATDLQRRDLINAQREQIIDDIIRAYLITLKTNPGLENDVFAEIRGIDPYLMDSVREITKQTVLDEELPMTLPQIRRALGMNKPV